MQSVDTLIDLPKAWLFRLSTHLTAESAARLRGTSKLLQKVIDATWEPDAPPPPHRRSAPLTYQQVNAQLPPHKPWKPQWLQRAAQIKAARAAGKDWPPGELDWVEQFAVAAAAMFDPLVAEARAAKTAAGPEVATSSAAAGAANAGNAASSYGRCAPPLTPLEQYMAERMRNRPLDALPADGQLHFDGDHFDSRGKQLLAEQLADLLPAVQPQGASSGAAAAAGSSSGAQTASVGDFIRNGLAPRKANSSSSEVKLCDVTNDTSRYDDGDFEDDEEVDGVDPYWREVFGPALTRLTANQACNLLKGKSVLCWSHEFVMNLNVYSTASERLEELREVTFSDGRVLWPPVNITAELASAEGDGRVGGSDADGVGGEGGVAGASGNGSEDGGSGGLVGAEGGSDLSDEGSFQWPPRRGTAGWGDEHGGDEFSFRVDYNVPATLREQRVQGRMWGQLEEPRGVSVFVGYDKLLATTDSSCRDATAAEVQQFVSSTDAADGDRFDIYLSHHMGGVCNMYVFLGPTEGRLTGQLKATTPPAAAAAGGAVVAASGRVCAARTAVAPVGLGRGLS